MHKDNFPMAYMKLCDCKINNAMTQNATMAQCLYSMYISWYITMDFESCDIHVNI